MPLRKSSHAAGIFAPRNLLRGTGWGSLMAAFKKFFVMMGLFLLILGALVAYKEYDLAANYDRIPATVTRVEELCYLEKRERGLFGRTTTKTQEGPCDAVRALNETHPEYRSFDLVKVTYVEFRYRSPADGNLHRGKDKLLNRKSNLPLRAGDEGVVYAHKVNPEEVERFRTSL